MARWTVGSEFLIETCYTCKVEFGMPRALYEVALQAAEKFNFYCPYGHSQHYVTGKSDYEKMREERDWAMQRVAEWQDHATEQEGLRRQAERQAAAAKGRVTRLKNRASAGVCPCCNRHFVALERHMHTKHPDFKKEDA